MKSLKHMLWVCKRGHVMIKLGQHASGYATADVTIAVSRPVYHVLRWRDNAIA